MSHPRNLPLPDDFEEMEFEIVDEHWNEYELGDGNRIQGRIFLRKIIRDPNNPNSLNISASEPFYVVYASAALRGEQGNEPRQQELEAIPKLEVPIINNNEQFNIYRIKKNGQEIRLRLTVIRILRVSDRFDNEGMPFYIIEAGPMFIVVPPPSNQGQ